MNKLLIANQDYKDLIEGKHYAIKGKWFEPFSNICYYQVVINNKVILYKPKHFKKEINNG
jgi:hypothetical protein|tara:strand:+ start:615 stop:794 length:180 start_codon:yes stop_codon:yes gene_type:complete